MNKFTLSGIALLVIYLILNRVTDQYGSMLTFILIVSVVAIIYGLLKDRIG